MSNFDRYTNQDNTYDDIPGSLSIISDDLASLKEAMKDSQREKEEEKLQKEIDDKEQKIIELNKNKLEEKKEKDKEKLEKRWKDDVFNLLDDLKKHNSSMSTNARNISQSAQEELERINDKKSYQRKKHNLTNVMSGDVSASDFVGKKIRTKFMKSDFYKDGKTVFGKKITGRDLSKKYLGVKQGVQDFRNKVTEKGGLISGAFSFFRDKKLDEKYQKEENLAKKLKDKNDLKIRTSERYSDNLEKMEQAANGVEVRKKSFRQKVSENSKDKKLELNSNYELAETLDDLPKILDKVVYNKKNAGEELLNTTNNKLKRGVSEDRVKIKNEQDIAESVEMTAKAVTQISKDLVDEQDTTIQKAQYDKEVNVNSKSFDMDLLLYKIEKLFDKKFDDIKDGMSCEDGILDDMFDRDKKKKKKRNKKKKRSKKYNKKRTKVFPGDVDKDKDKDKKKDIDKDKKESKIKSDSKIKAPIDKVKSGTKAFAKGAAKVVGKAVPVIGVAMAAYDAKQGYDNPEEYLDIKEGQDINTKHRASAATGAAVEGFTFGLVDGKNTATGVNNVLGNNSTLEKYVKMGIVNYNTALKSDIDDWSKLKKLSSAEIQEVISIDDWSDKDMKKLNGVLMMAKSREKPQDIKPKLSRLEQLETNKKNILRNIIRMEGMLKNSTNSGQQNALKKTIEALKIGLNKTDEAIKKEKELNPDKKRDLGKSSKVPMKGEKKTETEELALKAKLAQENLEDFEANNKMTTENSNTKTVDMGFDSWNVTTFKDPKLQAKYEQLMSDAQIYKESYNKSKGKDLLETEGKYFTRVGVTMDKSTASTFDKKFSDNMMSNEARDWALDQQKKMMNSDAEKGLNKKTISQPNSKSTEEDAGNTTDVSTEYKGDGPLFKDVSQVMSKNANVNFDGLQPDMRHNLFGMATDYAKMTGKKFHLNSAHRDVDYQAKLFDKKYNQLKKKHPNWSHEQLYKATRKWVAPPGNSMHNWGVAIDAPGKQLNKAKSLGLFKKWGLHRPLSHEDWHMEAAGINRAKIRETGKASMKSGGKFEVSLGKKGIADGQKGKEVPESESSDKSNKVTANTDTSVKSIIAPKTVTAKAPTGNVPEVKEKSLTNNTVTPKVASTDTVAVNKRGTKPSDIQVNGETKRMVQQTQPKVVQGNDQNGNNVAVINNQSKAKKQGISNGSFSNNSIDPTLTYLASSR